MTTKPARPGAARPRTFGRIGLTLGLAALGGLGASTAWAQARYSAVELPVLPGTVQCTATGLNELSEVVGHCGPAFENWNQTAVVWRQGSVQSLGKWPNGTYSQGTTINSFGRIAGHADEGNLRPQGWVTLANGRWVNFFPNSSGNTYPLFVGDNGWVGGYFIKGSKGLWTAAIWRPDSKDPTRYRLEAFPHLPGAANPRTIQTLAEGFNRAGVGVGQSAHDRAVRAVLWRNNAAHTLEVLPHPPGGEASIAQAINDLGQVVGSGGRVGVAGGQAVWWANDSARTAQFLPNPPGLDSAGPRAINNLGQVVGMAANVGDPVSLADNLPERPVIWRDGGVFELQALLDPAALSGMRLEAANDLNDRGQIAATGVRNGLKRALLLTPVN